MADFNKGDISEAILACAIAARFKKRLDVTKFSKEAVITLNHLPIININDVHSILKDVVTNNFVSNYSVNDSDSIKKINSNITDSLTVDASIPAKSAAYLAKPINWGHLSDIFQSAVNKVNSDTRITQKTYKTQFNLQEDKIVVSGVGTKDQKGTKVDIRIDIFTAAGNMRPRTSSQISLKYDAPQFAQSVGLEFNKFSSIFEPLGISNYLNDEQMFNSAIYEVYPDILGKRFNSRDSITSSNEVKALKKTARKIFGGRILSELKDKLKSREFRTLLAQYCIEKATKNESGVELVKFMPGGKAYTQKFGQRFIDSISATEFDAEFLDNVEDPTVVIFIKGRSNKTDKLIQFRYRTDARKIASENKYVIQMRTYVESGPLLYYI
jgi:hypothetical protein